MQMHIHLTARLVCLVFLGTGAALAQDSGITFQAASNNQASCTTYIGPAPAAGDQPAGAILTFKPGEQRELAITSWVRMNPTSSGTARQLAGTLQASWRSAPEPGTVKPDSGRVRLSPQGEKLAGEFGMNYTAPGSPGLYGLPVRAVLDPDPARAAGIPEHCLVAANELAVLVSANEPEPQYVFSLNGFYAGAGLARAGAMNRGSFRVDGAGKVSGEGTLDLWLEGQCFRSRERQALRIEGWREAGEFHLRLHEAGPRQKIEDWTSQELRCFLLALEEAGSLLTQAVADLSMGEVTFKVVGPGEEHRFTPDDNWAASIRGLPKAAR